MFTFTNPFKKKPLPQDVRSSAFPGEPGFPNEHFLMPEDHTYGTGLESPQNIAVLSENLRAGVLYNQGGVEYADNKSLEPDYSVHLKRELYQGLEGHAGSPRVLMASGPATGEDFISTGRNTGLVAPRPGYSGPVVGGQDYAQSIANAYFSAQAAAYSQQAAAEALVSAL